MRRILATVVVLAGLLPGLGWAQEEENALDIQQLEKKVTEYWSKVQPWALEEYQKIKNSEEKKHFLRELEERMRHLQELKRFMPDAYENAMGRMKLEQTARAAGKKFREATTDEERAKARAECKEAVEKLLKVRKEETRREVQEMESRISTLKKKLEVWDQNEDLVVENRVLQFTGAGEGLLEF